MSGSKVVVVFGATGVQGGSVIKSILGDPRAAEQFKLRGITRDPSKPNAQALAAKGVECVKGDVDSKESLRQALKGAYGVFAVTNFWEHMDGEKEEQQGKNVADVCKEMGVQHLIWSSLIHVSELTKGKFPKVSHFDSKANVEKYIRSINIPATFFMPGYYLSNLTSQIRPNPQSEAHEYLLALPMPPDTPLPLFDAADDTGKFVKAILLHGKEVLGKRVYAATAYYTPEEIAQEFAAVKPVAGKGAHFVQIPPDMFKGFLAQAGLPEAAQEEMLQNMQFMHDYGYYGKDSLDDSLKLLAERPTTWKEYLAKDPAFKDLK